MAVIERWRVENTPDGACVVSDQDEPGTVMALCGRRQDAEEIAAALNNSRGAVSMVEALTRAARGTSSAGGVYCKLCNGFDAQAWEDLTHSCPLGGQS
jgi:hypothetical protein